MTPADSTRMVRCAVALAILLAGAVRAQTPLADREVGETFDFAPPMAFAAATSPGMSFVTSEMGSSRLVKGAPYSADAVSESTQTLMDGNKITRRSVQRLARDGEGRTRIERLRSDGTVESVVINDVVAGKRYWLLPDKKRVIELHGSHGARIRMAPVAPVPAVTPTPSVAVAPQAPPAPPVAPVPPTPPPSMSGEEARSWAEDMRRWARDFSARLRAEQPDDSDSEPQVLRDRDGNTRVIVREARRGGFEDDPRSVDVDVVRVIESANDAGEATAAIAAIAPVAPAGGVAGPGVTTALGSKEFDRVRADGSRTTWTIPAGKIGNEKPIDVISDRWYSPELLLVVSSRYLDPRRGETTFRLTGLKRGEPDASLFTVPADYEGRPARGKREERGKN